jgi:RNA polymerase sigma-70 factor (ECF subfamily)
VSDELEGRVRGLVTAGDIDGATTAAIAGYGPELHGFLVALAKDTDLGSEAFALACEQMWRGLAKFRWEASLRTWAYHLARNALHQLRRDPRRRPERNLPLSVVQTIEAIPRTPTGPHQKSDVKAAMRALRDSLDPEDHEVLILRIDRNMAWKDIARATAETELDSASLDARAALLRKRYERTKAQLRELATKHGLLDDD